MPVRLSRSSDSPPSFDHTHCGAAGSLRAGTEETLTMIRLGIKGKSSSTRASRPTRPMIDTVVRRAQRNVKHSSSGEIGGKVKPPARSGPRVTGCLHAVCSRASIRGCWIQRA